MVQNFVSGLFSRVWQKCGSVLTRYCTIEQFGEINVRSGKFFFEFFFSYYRNCWLNDFAVLIKRSS